MIYYVDVMKHKEIVDRLEERIKWLDQWLKDNDKHDGETHENFYKPFWAERVELLKIRGEKE